MIKITDKVVQASTIFNDLLKSGVIEGMVREMPESLDNANVSSDMIADFVALYMESFSTKVRTYRPWNPWSAAIATTYTGNFSLIKLNSRRLERSVPSIIGSIAHEWGHCLEYYVKSRTPHYFFNHGSNSPVGKDNTFQYRLGRMVESYLDPM